MKLCIFSYCLKALLFLFLLPFSSLSWAQSVDLVDGEEVQLTLGDLEDVAEGTKLFATDENGKKKAVIEITNVDDQAATGKILKGNAESGYGLMAGTSSKKSKSPKSKNKKSRSGWAFSGGARFLSSTLVVSNATATVGVTTYTLEVSTPGTGFSGQFAADYLLGDFVIGGEGRVASMNFGGTSSMIFDFGVTGKYRISDFVAMAGFAPITNISNSSSSQSGNTLSFGAGYSFSKVWQAAGEYRMHSFNTVKVNSLTLGANFYF